MNVVIANVVPTLLIFSALMMEAIPSSKTFVLTRATWRHISEDGILKNAVDNTQNSVTALISYSNSSQVLFKFI
jgi:hypothetical protein